MTSEGIELNAGLADLDRAAWYARLAEIGDELGYCENLGPRHVATFIDAGPQLLVTFETHRQIETSADSAEPRGFNFVRTQGWSHLALIADGDTWFRDDTVYRYFDRLVDDGFFEDFDNVLFFGAHAGGYAAAAFGVAAPGARVLAIRPQATLDPAVTGWDPRYRDHRRLCFTDRYGYAPDMIDAAAQAWIAFDPAHPLDAMHAALFRRANVTALPCRYLGWQLDQAFDAMDIATPLVVAAMDGSLTAQMFARLFRARRDHLPYLRNLLQRLENAGRDELAVRLCRHAIKDRSRPFFTRKLATLWAAGFAAHESESAE